MPTGNRRLAVKRTATGLGLFTLKRIPAGRRVIEYTGTLITNEEADEKGGKYLFGLDDKYTLDGSPRSNTARYINHSCAPNADSTTGKLTSKSTSGRRGAGARGARAAPAPEGRELAPEGIAASHLKAHATRRG